MSLLRDTQQTPPHSPRFASGSGMMPPERDPNRAVDALVGAIHNLASDDNYKVIADVFREAQDLRAENARLSSTTRDVLEEYRKFRNELEAEEDKLRGEKTQLQQSVEQKDSQIFGLESEKARLDVEVEEAWHRLTDESQRCLELVEKKDELERSVTDLEATLHDKSKRLAELEETKYRINVELAEAKDSLDTKVRELADLDLVKMEIESLLAETQASLDDRTKELATVEEAKTTVEGQLAEVNAKLDSKTKEAEDFTVAQQALTTELAETSIKLSGKEKDFDDLSDVKASLETLLVESSYKLEESIRDVEALSEAKAKLESDLADSKTNLADKSKETEDLTLKLAETNTKLNEKTEDAMALTLDLAEADADLESKSSEIVGLSEAIATVETKLAELSEQVRAERKAKKVVEEELQATKDNLHKEAERAEVLSDEVAHLHQTVQDRNEEIEHLKGEVVEGKNSFDQAQLTIRQLEHITNGLEQELKFKKAKLDEIDRFQVKLTDEPEDACVEILDTIWVSILDLAEKHFSADLDETVLRDASCWANIRGSDYLKHAVRLPLPQSNSPAAKQMRIAAVLAVLSRSLARHVFRPTYLLDGTDDAGLARALRDLEAASPAHELHVRAALLAAQPPERAARGAAKRARAVVREVGYTVQHLLSALQFGAFSAALEACCGLACRQWGRVQRLVMKVEPYFGPPYDDFDWQVLMLLEGLAPGGGGGGGGGMAVSSGGSSALGVDAGGGARLLGSGAGDDASIIAESVRSVVDPADIMLVLWPSMCAVEGGELVSITQGLVMAKEQASAAFEEEGRRRPWLAHKRARSMSQSRKSMAGSPRLAKSFFAHTKTEGDASGAGGSSHGSVYDDRD